MAKAVESYMDTKGNLHKTPVNAVRSDIAGILGRVGDDGGLTDGVARLILEKRCEIEQAFADLDKLEAHNVTKLEVIEHSSKSA